MKRILILVAISLCLCATASGFQGGGGEATKKPNPTPKPRPKLAPKPKVAPPKRSATPTLGGVVTTPSGLKYLDEVVGTGDSPQTGQNVTAHYTGTLENGTKFDSSVDRGQPYAFQIGVGRVIKGWDEGVMTMKVGGKRRLIIPPNLGYGAAGSPPKIPANATLIFEVELLSVSADNTTPATNPPTPNSANTQPGSSGWTFQTLDIPAEGLRVYLYPGWKCSPLGGAIIIETPGGATLHDEPGVIHHFGFQPDGVYIFRANPVGSKRQVRIYNRW